MVLLCSFRCVWSSGKDRRPEASAASQELLAAFGIHNLHSRSTTDTQVEVLPIHCNAQRVIGRSDESHGKNEDKHLGRAPDVTPI